MTATPLLSYELITEDVRIPASGNTWTPSTAGIIVDLDIPADGFVAGSGVIVLQVLNTSGDMVDVTDYETVAAAGDVHTHSGPHPTDSAKWRFQIYADEQIPLVHLWMTVLTGP